MSEMAVSISDTIICEHSYLRESAIVPEIALVGEAVADKSKLALLDILFL
jgi:hypothetical protein